MEPSEPFSKFRFRNVFLVLGSLLVIAVWLLTDPDLGLIQNLPFGAGMIATIVILLKSVLYIGMLHIGRRALLDYLDLSHLFGAALTTAQSAGLAIIGVGLMMISVSLVILAATLTGG